MNNLLYITDQIHCYDSSGNLVSCDDTGQDAARKGSEKSLLFSKERFQLIEDVVIDGLTGHGWMQDANPAEFPLSWQEANHFVAEMNKAAFGSSSGWQLPDRRTLFSLVSHQHVNPSLPPLHPFKNVFPGYYWTSDTCNRLPKQAWYVHLGEGRVFRGMKHGSYLTWPVCPKVQKNMLDSERFFSAPPLVFDHRHKTTWLIDHPYLSNPLSWQEALDAIRKINREKPFGCSRWQLPNIRELESLVDIRTHSPAIFQDITLKGNVSISPVATLMSLTLIRETILSREITESSSNEFTCESIFLPHPFDPYQNI